VRWLLVKDVQILRRSPLLVALLVIYPIVVAVLIGAALSGGPQKPRVAFANLVPPGEAQLALGGRRVDASTYASRLFQSVDPIRVKTRAQAIAKVRSGDALGALVIPANAARRLRDTLELGAGPRPRIEVFYNAEDPVKRRYVESAIRSRLAEANAALSREVLTAAGRDLDLVVKGGKVSFPFVGSVQVLGLRRAQTLLDASLAQLPPDAPERPALQQVRSFAKLAADNLDLSKPILAAIGSPVEVSETVLNGSRAPLDAFAAAVAVAVSLMFVTLLLAAGLLALEREEDTFGRLVRGLVSRETLLAEKVVLSALCALVVTAAMLAGLAGFVGLDFGRAALWLVALAAGALAFAALGVTLGALAREVRAASLLALLLALPLAFLALVPSGAVSSGLFAAINVVSGAFPFKPTLRALEGAISGGALLVPALHLLGLAAGYGLVSRLALRRF
jgi:ABC-type transport system involved in cytochrome c biogenesis permease component